MAQLSVHPFEKKRAILSNLFKRWAENPIILKELRGAMRGRRAFIFLTIYLVVMSLSFAALYNILKIQETTSSWNPDFNQTAGKIIFGSIVGFEFLMIGFIGPALTAGAITSERERETFDILRTTLLSARTLVFGKLGSACTYLFLLIFTALPIKTLAFLIGGIGLEEIFVSSLMLVVNTVCVCALGLLCSSLAKRTLTATVTSYTIILLTTLAIGLIAYQFIEQFMPHAPQSIDEANIGTILLVLISATNPFLAGLISEALLITTHFAFFGQVQTGFNLYVFMFSPWIPHLAIYTALAISMILLSIFFVQRPDR